jgi:hypothetical protein
MGFIPKFVLDCIQLRGVGFRGSFRKVHGSPCGHPNRLLEARLPGSTVAHLLPFLATGGGHDLRAPPAGLNGFTAAADAVAQL